MHIMRITGDINLTPVLGMENALVGQSEVSQCNPLVE